MGPLFLAQSLEFTLPIIHLATLLTLRCFSNFDLDLVENGVQQLLRP